MSERQALYLRPTLIIGLGGSGYRIAVELKARLDERLGESSGYRRAIKFLCFDTANENFTAQYPSNPEITVAMSAESEFVRISDVPLHDLMRSRDTNAAIAAILPEVLYTTQIDQGAQQVRRLGRIALFHHYGRIKEKLTGAISALRQIDVIGQIGVSTDERYDLFVSDRNRLRVFILCSICGGTGSGTFIDMAYLVRYIAEGTGIASRACDVNGMLLLPEAFPNVVTTGAARIRANAYAALLDLEYYNQAANVSEPLYQVRMPGETLRVSGSPFSICYLVGGGSSEGPIGDVRQLSPILADALDALIVTSMGTKLDATLDNVRVGLSLDFEGFRTFYSALGISMIVHPELAMRRVFGHMLKDRIITTRFLKSYNPDDAALASAADEWIRRTSETTRRTLRGGIQDEDNITRSLRRLENEIGHSAQPFSDFTDAFRDVSRLFQQNVEEMMEHATPRLRREVEQQLREDVWRIVDDALLADRPGLHYAHAWLDALAQRLSRHVAALQRRQSTDMNRAYDREISYIEQVRSYPVIGRLALMRPRIREACGNLSRFVHGSAMTAQLDRTEQAIFATLGSAINSLRREVQDAITYWMDIRSAERSAALQRPHLTAVAQYTLSDEQITTYTQAAIDHLMQEPRVGRLFGELNTRFTQRQRGFSRTLDADERAALRRALDALCRDYFETMIQSANVKSFTDDVIAHLSQLNANPHERERYNTLIVNLRTQAQPLLIYGSGVLASVAPAQIRVVGGKNEDAIRQVWTGGVSEQSDVNFAATFDASRLIYLVTHHGIPINALSKFEEYRAHYEAMKSVRNAIFHLDNEREDEPYDPKSMYFVNLEDLQSYFARALAYDGLHLLLDETTPETKSLLVITEPFFRTFRRQVDDHLNELYNAIDEIDKQLAAGALREDRRVVETARRKALYAQSSALQERTNAFTPVHMLSDFVADPAYDNAYMLPVWRNGGVTGPAKTLTEGIEALYSGTRLVARLFQQTVTDFEQKQPYQNLLEAVDRFLDNRRYVGYRKADDPNVIVNQMLLSHPGQADYSLELHLCALLSVYRRLKMQETFSQRWIPSGYHLLKRGYLIRNGSGSGSGSGGTVS